MTEEEKNLRDLLARLFWREPERERLLSDADIPIWEIDGRGSPLDVWHKIVEYTAVHELTTALVREARRRFPNDPVLRIAQTDGLRERRGPEIAAPDPAETAVLEALTGDKTTLLPIHFLRRGVESARSVAKIVLADGTCGTGFLLPDNWLLTNRHVLPDIERARTARAQFGFEEDEEGVWQPPDPYACQPDSGFHVSGADPDDDWAVVRLERNPNAAYGALDLAADDAKEKDFVNIIQHPGGAPKQIAIYHNTVSRVLPRRLRYLTDTAPGSSGSPVFNARWQVVALHHASALLGDPATPSACTQNQGILASVLRHALIEAGVLAS